MHKRTFFLFTFLIAFALILVGCNDDESSSDDNDNFPEKPIDVIVAYDAGGGTDTGARLLTDAAEKVSDDSFVVENRPGAGGETGYNQLANSENDGYTIGFINLPTFVSLPLQRDTEYDIEDVDPIMLHVYDPAVLIVGSDSTEIDNLDGFLDYAEKNPGEITIANNGTGASDHIIAADFENEADIDLNHVPFDGTNELVTAIRGGDVKAGVAKISEVSDHIESGELTAVAAMTEEPLDELPDVPTLKENDIDVVGASGRGVVAPKGTDPEVIDYIHDVLKEAMESEEHVEQADNSDLPLRHMGPEEFGEFIEEQSEENKELQDLIDLD